MPATALQDRGEASKAPASAVEAAFAGYKGKEAPLGGYGVLMGLYGLTMAGFAVAHRRSGKTSNLGVGDIVLLGVATHKLSRLITKDWVTSPIRAPFTEYKESTSAGEVEEKARGTGLQQATGQLFT